MRLLMMAVIVAAIFGAADPAQAIGEFRSGNWRGGAYFNGSQFTHCAMSAEYDGGWRLLFTMQRTGDVILGLSHPDLHLTRGSKATVLMQIDSSPIIERQFVVISPTLIGTRFTSSVEWFQRLRRGLRLKMKFGKTVRSFSLRGTNEALIVLFACTAKYRRL